MVVEDGLSWLPQSGDAAASERVSQAFTEDLDDLLPRSGTMNRRVTCCRCLVGRPLLLLTQRRSPERVGVTPSSSGQGMPLALAVPLRNPAVHRADKAAAARRWPSGRCESRQ